MIRLLSSRAQQHSSLVSSRHSGEPVSCVFFSFHEELPVPAQFGPGRTMACSRRPFLSEFSAVLTLKTRPFNAPVKAGAQIDLIENELFANSEFDSMRARGWGERYLLPYSLPGLQPRAQACVLMIR